MGAFPSNHMNNFINHAALITEKKGKYPLVIANTDSSEKGDKHWWNIVDIEPKTNTFLFDSLGLDGSRHFIIQDDKIFIKKVLFGTEKVTRTDKKNCSL